MFKAVFSKAHLFFALICILNLIVYWPSLKHVPRSDQIAYLSTVADQKDWQTLAIKDMGLNRGTKLSSGDTWLFRPLLYALLGTERFFFGYSFYLWQLAGIVFHLLFLWALWKLLFSINGSWLALLFTAVFSVMPVNLDLVIWQHINGYLVALILMFLSVRNCLLFLQQQRTLKSMLVVNIFMLTVASLFCEFSVFFTLGLIIYLWRTWPKERQGKKWIYALLLPILIFLIINVTNWIAVYYSNLPQQGGYEFQRPFLGRGLANIPCVFFRWLRLGALPFHIQFYFLDGRYTMKTVSGFNPLTVLNIILIIKGIFVLIKGGKLLKGKEELKNLFFFFIGLTLVLCVLFSVFRVGPRSLGYLKHTLYWAYIFWSLLITAVYILISQDCAAPFLKWSFANKIFAASCLILTLSYGWLSYRILQKRAIDDQPSARLIASIEQSRKNTGNGFLDFKQLMMDPGNRKYKYFGNRSLIEMLYPSGLKN